VQQKIFALKAATDSIRSDFRTDRIRRWLCPTDPSTNTDHTRTLRHQGTDKCLQENPNFQSRHLGSGRNLWLRGLAGCGRTVLSATVLDYLTKENDGFILHFSFDLSDMTERTLDGMLRSLAFRHYRGGVGSAAHLSALSHVSRNDSDQPATKVLSDVVSRCS
jgi:hypothetical protein